MADLSFTARDVEGVTLVALRSGCSPRSMACSLSPSTLWELVDPERTRGLVLDFASIRFVTRDLADALVDLRRQADRVGLGVVVSSIGPELQRLLRLRQLDKLFRRFETFAGAAEYFANASSDENPNAA